VFNTVLQSLTISEFKSHFQLTPTQTEVGLLKLMLVLPFANLICTNFSFLFVFVGVGTAAGTL